MQAGQTKKAHNQTFTHTHYDSHTPMCINTPMYNVYMDVMHMQTHTYLILAAAYVINTENVPLRLDN